MRPSDEAVQDLMIGPPSGTFTDDGSSIKRDLQSNLQDVRRTLATILEALRARNIDEAALGSVETVMAEVLNNIVEHAYEERDGGVISLAIDITDQGLSCTVTDEGKAMPDGRVPAGEMPDASGPLEDLPEGGFGWFLIRSLTSDLIYQRRGHTNVLSFRLPC